MSEDKIELNENELDKVNGGTYNFDGRAAANCPMTQCRGSSCPVYDSCTKDIKE